MYIKWIFCLPYTKSLPFQMKRKASEGETVIDNLLRSWHRKMMESWIKIPFNFMTKSWARLRNYSAINITDCQWKYNKIHPRAVKCGSEYFSPSEKSLMLRCLLFGSPFMHSNYLWKTILFVIELQLLFLSAETKGPRQREEKSFSEGETWIKSDYAKGAFVIYFTWARKLYSAEVKKSLFIILHNERLAVENAFALMPRECLCRRS